jgi:hypothetical protein
LRTTRKVFEIDTAQKQPYRGHYHVIDERSYDFVESGADNDTYSHVNGVTFDGELLEFRY